MSYPCRIRPRGLEDDILSAFAHQLPRCIVYLLYFCCISNYLICCSLCDMKEEGAKVKRENNLQGDKSFSGLQNMLFLVSSLSQVSIEQITVLGRFGVYISITFWVEVNEVYLSQATFFLAVAAYSQYCIYKMCPPLVVFGPLLRNPGDGSDCSKRHCD